tara:strand:+ start:49 stop:1803 length:1755 start_codon:yes stop_codon:yes gene_type:complete
MKKLILPILFLLGLPLVFQVAPVEILKLKTFDAFVTTPEPSGNFVILNITEEDVDAAGGYPFPREELAKIHLDLLRKGALGVGWVLAFPHEDRFGGDHYFKEALSYAPSVIAVFENDNGIYPKTVGTVIMGEGNGGYMSKGTVQNISGLNAAEGVASAPVDIDNLVRRIPLLYKTPEGWLAAYGTQVLKALTGAKTYVIKTNTNGLEEIRVKGLPPVKVDSLGRKWVSWVDTPTTTLKEMNVKNKFVFVGVTAKGVMPQLATPTGLLEPHKIQAALAESILVENSPYIPDYSIAVEVLVFVISLLLVWVALNNLGITAGVLCFGVVMSSTAIGGYYAIQQGLLIDATWSLISQFITGTVAFYLRFREQFKLRLQIKKQFEHYLDPRQVKQLQKNPDLLKLGGEKKTATFLFTDVRGFTALSESVTPEEVTYIMNKALTAQQAAVQKHGGMVDKYIGDAMMAIFNAPLDLLDHPNIAVSCAQDIWQNMSDLNVELQAEGLPPIAIGIGINTGEAVIGNMGSSSRFDYTAIGDAVNTAARLESATKEAGADILIGENTKNLCKHSLKELTPMKVKGKEKPLKIYTL